MFVLATALLALASQCVSAINLTVSSTGGNASSPLLYGFMFEDINYSGNGVLHGQLLKNNGFQGNNPGLTAWTAVGDATITQDTSNPLTTAIKSTLQINTSSDASGTVGASNAGYLGIRVIDDTYANYFYVKGTYNGDVSVSLVGSDGTVYGSKNVAISTTSSKFTYYETSFHASAASTTGVSWHFTFDAAKATDGGLNLGLPQLFPTTFHTRYNGLNLEVGNALNAVKGSFLRFPGGNNLEGGSVASRWIWNNTIGPVQNRPGRQGDWGYANTDALGLVEYLLWCQDMSLTPVLAVWSGLTLGGGVISGNALEPYVQSALDELEYLMGSTSTTWGALRASHGHAAPFDIPYVEIGNEDFLNDGQSTYQSRFNMFYDAIHAAYPDIKIISTIAGLAETGGSTGTKIDLPDGAYQDVHQYLSPDGFVAAFNAFDNVNRSQPILVGEYASTTNNDGSRSYYTTMQGSTAEAIYMIGMERNSDVVKMASYAPLLEHFNLAQWSPDLIGFAADTGVTRSTSYFVQQMFSVNRGETILPITSDTGFNPAFWVASSTGTKTIVKLANYGTTVQTVSITIKGKTTGTLTQLSGSGSNHPGEETIKPVTSSVTGSGGIFSIKLPAWSVSVLVAQ